MIEYEFGPPHEHEELELDGIWMSPNSISLWFPVAQPSDSDSDSAPVKANYLGRSSLLIQRIGLIFFSVTSEIKTVFEHPAAEESNNPLICPSELYLEQPTEGLMVVEAEHLMEASEPGEDLLKQCVTIAADVYGDLMLERVRQ